MAVSHSKDSASQNTAILVEQFLIKEARNWGIKVYRNFQGKETRLIFPCGMFKSDGEVETINTLGLLLAKTLLPRKKSGALATFPFKQEIPMTLARRYLCRDVGCRVFNEKEDGTVAVVQTHVVDLNEGWYANKTQLVIEQSAGVMAPGADLNGMDVDPEAIKEFRIMVRNIFGPEADKYPISACTRQYQHQSLVFVGRAEDIHLFLRNQEVRKLLSINEWTQRGYTARDRNRGFCAWCDRRYTEVELGPWNENVAMYADAGARTDTTVQPLKQFKQEKALGEDVTDLYQDSQN